MKINLLINGIKKFAHVFLLFLFCPAKYKIKFLINFRKSNSQLHQDLFVLSELGFKEHGFFVEFGSCDGFYLSNTFILEKYFNWSGILSEPCKSWHQELRKNRKSIIDFRCVGRESADYITFFEDADPALSGMYIGSDDASSTLKKHNKTSYDVVTVSLNDLLNENHAPSQIDFLSIDTEGSELEILSSFDFFKFKVKIICVEHNYSSNRDKIKDLMNRHGYKRKYKRLSRFDDWYVLNSIN